MRISVWTIKKKTELPQGYVLLKKGKNFSIYKKKWSDNNVDYRIVGNKTKTHYYQIKAQSPDAQEIYSFEKMLMDYINWTKNDKEMIEDIKRKAKDMGIDVVEEKTETKTKEEVMKAVIWDIQKHFNEFKYYAKASLIAKGKEFNLYKISWTKNNTDYIIVGAQSNKAYYLIKVQGDPSKAEKHLKSILDYRTIRDRIPEGLKSAGYQVEDKRRPITKKEEASLPNIVEEGETVGPEFGSKSNMTKYIVLALLVVGVIGLLWFITSNNDTAVRS